MSLGLQIHGLMFRLIIMDNQFAVRGIGDIVGVLFVSIASHEQPIAFYERIHRSSGLAQLTNQ